MVAKLAGLGDRLHAKLTSSMRVRTPCLMWRGGVCLDAALVEADKVLRELLSAVISGDRMDAPTSIIIFDDGGSQVGQVTTEDLIRKTFQI